MYENSSIKALLKWGEAELINSGLDDAKLSCELLLSETLAISRTNLYAHIDDIVDKSHMLRFKNYIKRRKAKEPIQYILNKAYFCDLELRIIPGVLIPRPETELLVEYVKKYLLNISKPYIADLCTGSGCIAVSLAKDIKDSNIYATDISKDACDCALDNVKKYNLKNVKIIQSNLGDAILQNYDNLKSKFDCVMSNPPYVPDNVYESLDDEVKLYEPSLALKAGHDGLDYVRDICDFAKKALKPNGLFALELHETSLFEAKKIVAKCGFVNVEIIKDLSGKNRFLFSYQ